jgi:uncharacterized protein|tara:strand:+ start:97 stop:684 length:588 start_codon:yes stop_codon:yes gene_type:complete
MSEIEMRSAPAEVRLENDTIKVSGYASVFSEETNIGGMFREVIAPGAFKAAIGRDDVRFLVNHDGLPLARTKSGTLILKEDNRGLYMETELDATDPDVQQIVPKMKRGDLDKMSFAFRATKQDWDESGDIPLRTIREAELFDVSIVNDPAYPGTEIGLRCFDAFKKEIKKQNFNAAAKRTRMKINLGLRTKRTAE